MTLDEAKETLSNFYFGDGGAEDEDAVRVLDITPGTQPGLYHALLSIARPGADTGILTGREIEAIRLYVGQWNEKEALALVTEAYLNMARNAEPTEDDLAAVATMLGIGQGPRPQPYLT